MSETAGRVDFCSNFGFALGLHPQSGLPMIAATSQHPAGNRFGRRRDGTLASMTTTPAE